jgi:hypothetical protein
MPSQTFYNLDTFTKNYRACVIAPLQRKTDASLFALSRRHRGRRRAAGGGRWRAAALPSSRARAPPPLSPSTTIGLFETARVPVSSTTTTTSKAAHTNRPPPKLTKQTRSCVPRKRKRARPRPRLLAPPRPATMQLPVTVLNASTKRESGKKAQFGNIAAAKVRRECSVFLGEGGGALSLPLSPANARARTKPPPGPLARARLDLLADDPALGLGARSSAAP